MQYTIRNIPQMIDRALRERARREGRSLNEVVVLALARALGVDGDPVVERDLGTVRGHWHEDAEFDLAIQDQHRIDESIWQ